MVYHSVFNLDKMSYGCLGLEPDSSIVCILPQFDFSRIANMTTARTLPDGFAQLPWHDKTRAVFDLLLELEPNRTTVSLAAAADACADALPPDASPRARREVRRFYQRGRGWGDDDFDTDGDGRLTEAQWQSLHDVRAHRFGVLDIGAFYFGSSVESTNRFVLVLYMRYLFFCMAANNVPVLYSPAVAASPGAQPAAWTEVRRRTERVLWKNMVLVQVPSLLVFGLVVYQMFVDQGELPWVRVVFRMPAFLMTAWAFGAAPFVWAHLDTHLLNVRRTARMVLGAADGAEPAAWISHHYADSVAALQVFSDLWGPVMLCLLLAAGLPSLTNALLIARSLMDGSDDANGLVTSFVVTCSTGCVFSSILWKISRVHIEHRRLASLVAYRKLDGALSGMDALARTRGSVRIFNVPVTPRALLLVPELVAGLAAAALVPVLARELSTNDRN